MAFDTRDLLVKTTQKEKSKIAKVLERERERQKKALKGGTKL